MPRMTRSLFSAVFLFSCVVAHAASEQQISFVGDGKACNVVAVASGTAQYKAPFLKMTLDDAVARATDVPKIHGVVELIRREGFREDGNGDAYVMAQAADAVVPLLSKLLVIC